MRAALYLRMSVDRTGEMQGIDRQRVECQRLAKQRGWTVEREIVDNDKSASYGTRDGFEQLLELMTSGEVDVVIAWHMDRLLRKMTDLERIIEVVERTGTLIATVTGDIDLSNDTGRMVGRILASVARAEVERKSARQLAANTQRAAAGLPHPNRRTFGYESDLMTVREDEALALREMARRILAGSSYKDVARWLNREGIKTTMGNDWHSITVRNLLTKKRYVGIREHRGVEYAGTWKPIFDTDTWQQLQLTMRMRSETATNVPRSRKYLLTGLAFCGICGMALSGSMVRDQRHLPKRRIYGCRGQSDNGVQVPGCGRIRRNADALDHFVAETVFYRLDSPDLAELLSAEREGNELPILLSNRQAQQQRLDGLTDDFATGLLDRDMFKRASATAQRELSRLDGLIEAYRRELRGVNVPAGQSVREAWADAADGWRRNLLELLIKRVVVMPGATKPYYYVNNQRMRFDPSLIHILWIS